MDTRPGLVRHAPWLALAVSAALVAVLAARHRDLSRAYERLHEWAILPHPGLEVPAFTTSTIDGAPVTIGAAAVPATRQVLFILSTTCPYCRATLPVWQRIADSLRRVTTPKIELYAISLDPAESSRVYALANHLSYPLLTFPEQKLARLYRAVATPETVVLDAGGRVLFARTGLLDALPAVDSVLRAATSLPGRASALPRVLSTPIVREPED